MKVELINSYDARKVLCQPDIYDCITDDGAPSPLEANIPATNEYIGGFIDGDLIGVMVYHKVKEDIYCHVQVLRTHRANHAEEFGRRALEFKEGLTLHAEIPEIYPNVLSFAKSFGFTITGTNENAGIKNGKQYKSYLLRRV